MDQTSESPHDEPDGQDGSVAKAESARPADPSTLLASAAAALDKIDDPEFEGPVEVDAESANAAKHDSANHPRSSSGDYGRAVLSIETPVAVVLAKQRISIDKVVQLVPGSMLTFDAHCDEPLTLEAGGHPIAVGETVKIGDKFGLRIRQLLDSTD